MIKNIEKNTIDAINDLKNAGKPFAAGMLCYISIERCLKIYLLEKRAELTRSDIDYEAKVGKKGLKFVDYQSSSRDNFILEFLSTCSLGALEIIFRIKNQKIADYRNDLMHSNIYLVCQTNESTVNRQKDNYKEFDIAVKNLIFVSENCFKEPVKFDGNGDLIFI